MCIKYTHKIHAYTSWEEEFTAPLVGSLSLLLFASAIMMHVINLILQCDCMVSWDKACIQSLVTGLHDQVESVLDIVKEQILVP